MDTLTDIRTLLRRLDGEPADAIESETLECKPWDPHPRAFDSQVRELRETVVCLANARGGVIVLGVADGKRTRGDAIHGVGTLDADGLRKRVYDGTEPKILVEVEELVEPEGRLLLVRVPRGLPPHTTSEGVGRVRVGKECKPLVGSELSRLFLAGGQRDLTAEPVPGASEADLDPEQLRTLARIVEHEGGSSGLARLSAQELLRNLELVRDRDVTLAAVLLCGRSTAIARWAPHHEVVFVRYRSQTRYDVRRDLKGPLLAVLDAVQQLLEAHLRIETLPTEGLAELTVPDITWWVAREAVLNALVHRDYFLRQAVYVEIRPDSVEVVSPGGFVGGVTPQNILRHPPVRRNPLLASVFQAAGLVNRAGLGVDRIHEELLALGKGMPRYEADEAHVRLRLPTRTHAEFARFVSRERREGRTLELNDLLVLRGVADRGHLDRWSAARVLQLGEDEAAEQLVSLRERGYLVAQGRGRGTAYRLARRHSDLVRGRAATDLDTPLDDEAIQLRIEAVLAERGQLTNSEVRRLSGYSRPEVVRLMQRMRARGLVVLHGRGRAARWLPGKRLRASRRNERTGSEE
jgi:ATP-dependent DNA helicase RecG